MPNNWDQQFKRVVAIANKDVRRISLITLGTLEALAAATPGTEASDQLIRESQAVIQDHADERGIWGDPFRDERHNAYIFAKRNLPEKYHKEIGVSAGTPADYDAAWRAKYLS
jgi:hypothetical protein